MPVDIPATIPSAAKLGWADRLRAWQTRIIADPRFRRFAARFAPTRGLARREARAVFDLCAGFVYSQILFACVRAGVLDLLAAAPRDAGELGRASDMTHAAMSRLLDAAVALRLVALQADGRYALAPRGAVVRADPGIRAMIEHHAMFYRDLEDPLALLRATAPATELGAYWRYTREGGTIDGETVAAYSRLMTQSQPLVADGILDAYPFARHRHLMDVGGGEGGFVAAVAARHPDLALTMVDLPPVAERARAALAARGVSASIRVVGGDFRRDVLPQGADIATLVRVLHDHDDGVALELLRSIRAVLPQGGTVLIGEPMADAPGAETVGAAYFGFYFLAMGQGRARRPAEIAALLTQAGFADAKAHPTALPLQVGVMSAVNPSVNFD
jgi:demethylspheroidene O-methyltransferase